MIFYWDDEAVLFDDEDKMPFTVKVYKSDNTSEEVKNVKQIVVDVEKTSGISVMNLLHPDYEIQEKRFEILEKRIKKLENKKSLFERIFKK